MVSETQTKIQAPEANPPVAQEQKPLVVENLTLGYGEKTILEDVNFSVDPGEIVVIAGGSGCGKSTLLRGIIGLLEPKEGRVMLKGVDIWHADEKELAPVRRNVGVLFQSGALFGNMTLAQNVALPLSDATDLDRKTIDLLVRLKLALVDLDGYEENLPSELSGGMQKRAGLARAMALDPSVLFFDEPSAGLDPITGAELDQLILRLNAAQNTTMIIVTHELNSIYTIAHRVVMLDKGAKGIIAVGPPRELADKSTRPQGDEFFPAQAHELRG